MKLAPCPCDSTDPRTLIIMQKAFGPFKMRPEVRSSKTVRCSLMRTFSAWMAAGIKGSLNAAASVSPFFQLRRWYRCQLEFSCCPAVVLLLWTADWVKHTRMEPLIVPGAMDDLPTQERPGWCVWRHLSASWEDEGTQASVKLWTTSPLTPSRMMQTLGELLESCWGSCQTSGSLYSEALSYTTSCTFSHILTQWSYKCQTIAFDATSEHKSVHTCVCWKN